ncbi:hypothetical protein Taro_024197 [Colocasia esculenta]|uniref:Uncharacterized protein n=1 Tax=Colocasia esculenta TaxID=4460 RepID=A0A843UZN5_COLES|nr:hypothetical protein [Colocasia esculenta]
MRLLMGYFSCVAGSSTSQDRAAAAVVVVDWEGNLVRHGAPATVAELMLEAPGHLVASAEEAGRTRRALAMRADEPLWPGGVYFLLPAGRAGSRLPDQQMAAIDRARREGKRRGGRKSRRPASGGRAFPGVMACEEEEEKDEEEGKWKGGDTQPLFSGTSGDGGFPGFRGLGGGSRPWRPGQLEEISKKPVDDESITEEMQLEKELEELYNQEDLYWK